MSTADVVDGADFAKVAGPLLKEYVRKTSRTRDRLRELLRESERLENLNEPTNQSASRLRRDLIVAEARAARNFVSAMERFSRRVSQYLEHESTNLPARMEIELRLADLEQAAEALIHEANAMETWAISH